MVFVYYTYTLVWEAFAYCYTGKHCRILFIAMTEILIF